MPEASGVTSLASRRKPTGRVGKDKQEKVLQLKVVEDRMEEMIALKKAAEDATAALGDAIKKAAEDSGLLASVVRRFVVARAGESYEEKRREAEQLSLLFEGVGVVPRPS